MEIDDKLINLMFRRIEELNAKVNLLLEKQNLKNSKEAYFELLKCDRRVLGLTPEEDSVIDTRRFRDPVHKDCFTVLRWLWNQIHNSIGTSVYYSSILKKFTYWYTNDELAPEEVEEALTSKEKWTEVSSNWLFGE